MGLLPSREGKYGKMTDFSIYDHVGFDHCLRDYKAFKTHFNTFYRIPLLGSDRGHFKVSLFSDYGGLDRPVLYDGVRPVEKNVWESVLRMDLRPNPNFDLVLLNRAMERTYARLRPALIFSLTYFPDFVEKTSATFPWTAMGFRFKSDVLANPDFWDWVEQPWLYDCIWRISPKYELKNIADINANKIRTFIIPPLHLLWWQKVFFSAQDDLLKTSKFGTIRYGVNFAYGGFHLLMVKHKDRIVFGGDISGWDRLLPLMREVYDLRTRSFDRAELPLHLEWTIRNTVNSILLLPNGDLVEKDWGNNSGSGCTTGDNCIAHDVIISYKEEVYFRDFSIPTGLLLSDVYGDDYLGSIPIEFDFDVLASERDIYASFGLSIKAGTDFKFTGPVGAQFLGATCVLYKGRFLPTYSSERIYASLVISDSRHDIDDEVSKFYALLHLSWGDRELFDEIDRILCCFLRDSKAEGPACLFLRANGVPTWISVVHGFWMGLESYFYPVLGGGGFKNYVQHVIETTILRKA